MKPKKNKNNSNASPAPLEPFKLTPEQNRALDIRQQEWDKLTNFTEYFNKSLEFHKSGFHQEQLHFQAINVIHGLMEEEEWFSENTPYPFKVVHNSTIANLAFLTCGYLKKIALLDNQNAIKTLAYLTVEMTEVLTQLLTSTTESAKHNAALIKEIDIKFPGSTNMAVKSNYAIMQNEARLIPYWPMLRFLNTAANSKKQFKRIADSLQLGKECPINVSEAANYSLETPINSFVWKCLRHFQSIHSIIQMATSPGYQYSQALGLSVGPPAEPVTFEKAIEGYVITKIKSPTTGKPKIAGLVKREDIPIYKVSSKLPPLTKSTATNWADKAIMPYVKSNFSDLRKVPELTAYKTGPDGKRYAPVRKAVIQALKQMARTA